MDTSPSRAVGRFAAILGIVLSIAAPGCGSLIVTQQSVAALEGRATFDWERHETEGFAIYVEPGTEAAANLDAISADASDAKARVLAYLDEPEYEPTVSLFVVASRERMKDLIGRPSNAIAYYSSDSLCYVWANDLKVGAVHELLHVIAMNRWGVPQRWINEGAAVDCRGLWLGQDVDAVCKVLKDRGELPSLDDLTRRFGSLPGLASYPAAGSFVRFLRETYGLDAMRAVWEGGRQALPRAAGRSLNELEADWLGRVDAADVEGVEYDT